MRRCSASSASRPIKNIVRLHKVSVLHISRRVPSSLGRHMCTRPGASSSYFAFSQRHEYWCCAVQLPCMARINVFA